MEFKKIFEFIDEVKVKKTLKIMIFIIKKSLLNTKNDFIL